MMYEINSSTLLLEILDQIVLNYNDVMGEKKKFREICSSYINSLGSKFKLLARVLNHMIKSEGWSSLLTG